MPVTVPMPMRTGMASMSPDSKSLVIGRAYQFVENTAVQRLLGLTAFEEVVVVVLETLPVLLKLL